MNKKTILTWILITVLATGALVSCAPKQEAPAPEDPAATEEAPADDFSEDSSDE